VKFVVGSRLRILDFDIENRPLSYLGHDYTTAEITAIGAGWVGEQRVYCWLLGRDEPGEMLGRFLELYERADMVSGHYIRKHDLPIINGALMEYKLPTLGQKLTQDTCLDLVKRKDISASQENLAGMYNLPRHKHHMSQVQWREANRLTKAGLAQTRKRVVDDVRQHKALREYLIDHGLLKAPRLWTP
jgi:hypothetical protein